MLKFIGIIALSIALAACDEQASEPRSTETVKKSAAPASAVVAEHEVFGFAFQYERPEVIKTYADYQKAMSAALAHYQKIRDEEQQRYRFVELSELNLLREKNREVFLRMLEIERMENGAGLDKLIRENLEVRIFFDITMAALRRHQQADADAFRRYQEESSRLFEELQRNKSS